MFQASPRYDLLWMWQVSMIHSDQVKNNLFQQECLCDLGQARESDFQIFLLFIVFKFDDLLCQFVLNIPE